MPTEQISELERFLRDELLPVGQRIVDTLSWQPENNTRGGEQQHGVTYKQFTITRNKMYAVGDLEAVYQYSIADNYLFTDINVLEFHLQRIAAGKSFVR